jgi:hypothetical protein
VEMNLFGPDFVETLDTQQATIQEVFITSAYDQGARIEMGIMDMSAFTNLRRLGLMLDHLNWPKTQFDYSPQPQPISIRLPPNLEEL